MPRSYAHEYLSYWYAALEHEIGVALETDDRKKLTAILYEARSEAGDPELEALMLIQIGENELWIAKKATELQE